MVEVEILDYKQLQQTSLEFQRVFLEMGAAYEKDVGGIDVGFNGLLYYGHTCLLKEGGNLAGFVVGQSSMMAQEGEKVFVPTAFYLDEKHRTPQMLRTVTTKLIKALDDNGFHKLQLSMEVSGLSIEKGNRLQKMLLRCLKREHNHRVKENRDGRLLKLNGIWCFMFDPGFYAHTTPNKPPGGVVNDKPKRRV